MELMERLAKSPRGALIAGTVTAILVLVAVMLFGAPPWILIPAMWIGATAYIEMGAWVDRRLGRR
jgi:ABC-type multidrug transport system permease subunit